MEERLQCKNVLKVLQGSSGSVSTRVRFRSANYLLHIFDRSSLLPLEVCGNFRHKLRKRKHAAKTKENGQQNAHEVNGTIYWDSRGPCC